MSEKMPYLVNPSSEMMHRPFTVIPQRSHQAASVPKSASQSELFNASLPAVALPSKILVLIFSYLKSDCPATKGPSGLHLGWILVTYVCRHWRAVALSTPFLWIDVTNLGPQWKNATFMLAHSALLRLRDLNATYPVSDIARRLTQVHTLEIRGQWHVLRPLLERLHNPAPRLEVLWLQLLTLKFDYSNYPVPEIRGRLLSGCGPSLRSLSITNIYFQWPTFNFSNLVCLALCYFRPELYRRGEERRLPTVSALLAILDTTPNLQDLVLTHALSRSGAGSRHPIPVYLPRLQKIAVSQSIADTIVLFQSLVFDAAARVEVSCADSLLYVWESDERVCALIRLLVKHVLAADTIEGPPGLSCFIEPRRNPTVLRITFTIIKSGQPVRDVLRLVLPQDARDSCSHALCTALPHLPNDRICGLGLSPPTKMSAEEWTYVFKQTRVRWPCATLVKTQSDCNCECLLALLGLPVDAIRRLSFLYIDTIGGGLALEKLVWVVDAIKSCQERGVPLNAMRLKMAEDAEGRDLWIARLRETVQSFQCILVKTTS